MTATSMNAQNATVPSFDSVGVSVGDFSMTCILRYSPVSENSTSLPRQTRRVDGTIDSVPTQPSANPVHRSRLQRLQYAWRRNLGQDEQSAVLAWGAFTATFAGVRALTHWIKDGHGPTTGGLSLGGHHFHHYNIGIGTLAVIGAIAVHGPEKRRRHPTVALSYGTAIALIVDELALLLDLQDVYWAKEGRTSVDAAVTIIGLGGLMTAGFEFWPDARRALSGRRLRSDVTHHTTALG